jgi:DNA repair exonuclease SbcCD ATPase subunit
VRIEWLEIEGWMPFAEWFRLNLPAGPIAVIGSHSGDPRRSNRAGKTALLEAITWCLYGEHRKRLDDDVIHKQCSFCKVSIGLGSRKSDSSYLMVERSRTRSSSTKLVVSTMTEEFVGDAAQNAIVRAVGIGFDDYTATRCFRQGEVADIIDRSPSERLSLVSEWLQQSRWFIAKKLQAAKSNAADAKLAEDRAALATAAGYLLAEPDREAAENELALAFRGVVDDEAEITELSAKLMQLAEAEAQRSQHVEMKQLRVQAADLRKQLVGRVNASQRKAQAGQNLADKQEAVQAAKVAVDKLVQVRRAGFDGICPVTCEACPVAEEVTAAARAANELLSVRTAAHEAAAKQMPPAMLEAAAANSEVIALDRVAARYQQVVERGKELAATLPPLSDEEVPSAEPLKQRLEELRQRSSEMSRRVGELESMLAAATWNNARHAQLQAAERESDRAALVSRLALRAISSVPARIAAEQLDELELEANQLLEGTGVSLRFSWTRELGNKSPVCEECGYVYPSKRGDTCPTCSAVRGKKRAQELEILCDDGSGVEEDVRFNSGGTRAIVGSAIRLAASAMLTRLRSSRSAWAIVDEPFGSLDVENREQLARTFAGMLGSVGLEQALIVSHDPALLTALPNRIVVDKDGAASTARVE